MYRSSNFNRNITDDFQNTPLKTCATETGTLQHREVDRAELEQSMLSSERHCDAIKATPFYLGPNHCKDDRPNLGNNPSPPFPKSANALPLEPVDISKSRSKTHR